MQSRRPLWRRRAFATFSVGESISFVGSRVTDLALPLTAVLLLGATADQMGILTAVTYVPFVVVGVLAGVWVDRMRRRPILIASDPVSALAVGTSRSPGRSAGSGSSSSPRSSTRRPR